MAQGDLVSGKVCLLTVVIESYVQNDKYLHISHMFEIDLHLWGHLCCIENKTLSDLLWNCGL